jgi:polyisoprenoid-binding protein YceI
MMTTAVQPFSGTYVADPIHSSFGFSVRYSGLADYRGSLNDVQATLASNGAGAQLEGSAKAESISIQNPPQFRAHVLGPDFFDTDNHPTVSFRSAKVDLADDGTARVEGELTIRGVTRPVLATGAWTEAGGRAGLELETSFDRREFGIDWQMELPGGGIALDYQVTLTASLALVQPEDGEQG